MNVSWPTNGSVMILNASPAKGASSDAGRSIWAPSGEFGSMPIIAGISSGDGR